LILLDTHVVIWLAFDEGRISRHARVSIEEARRGAHGLAVSDFTLFELSMLFRKKRFELSISPGTFLSAVEHHFVVLPITADIALRASELPGSYPKDPADRVIGATAIVEGLELVTADARIRASTVVPTIW
jgi:PIN domain nuclease of toxin-antitoxin system